MDRPKWDPREKDPVKRKATAREMEEWVIEQLSQIHKDAADDAIRRLVYSLRKKYRDHVESVGKNFSPHSDLEFQASEQFAGELVRLGLITKFSPSAPLLELEKVGRATTYHDKMRNLIDTCAYRPAAPVPQVTSGVGDVGEISRAQLPLSETTPDLTDKPKGPSA